MCKEEGPRLNLRLLIRQTPLSEDWGWTRLDLYSMSRGGGAYRYPNHSLPGLFRELPATPGEWGISWAKSSEQQQWQPRPWVRWWVGEKGIFLSRPKSAALPRTSGAREPFQVLVCISLFPCGCSYLPTWCLSLAMPRHSTSDTEYIRKC